MHPAPLQLAGFLSALGDMIRIRCQPKGLHFEQRVDPELPAVVELDQTRLLQVLLNLLGNAVKFTDQGRVSLTVKRRPGSPGRLYFEVEDSGVGIGTEELARIFNPFEQVGDTRRQAAGTGLGLAISRQLVQAMGGELQVESQPGSGSRFCFELPAPRCGKGEAGPRVSGKVTGYQGAPRQILLVDDVATNRDLLRDWLLPLGFEIREAANGREALGRCAEARPDLVMMDLAMPEMDGREAIRQLRRTHSQRQLPIIAVSAGVLAEEREASLADGANGFLAKPVQEAEMLALLAEQMPLTWTYEAAPATATARPEAVAVDAGRIKELPLAALKQLHQLALAGDMRALVDELKRLGARYPDFAPLTEQLLELAGRYQSRAILQRVESLLEEKCRADAAPE